MTTRVLVPLAEGFEEIEAITPIDIWRRANFQVITAGLTPNPIRASRQTTHVAEAFLDDVLHENFDLIFLPGGQPGANNLAAHEKLGQRLQKQAADNLYIAAICAAPLVLHKYGLLKNKQFTCHPSVREQLGASPSSKPFVTDGKIITAPGAGAALPFALEIVKIFSGEQKAREIAGAILYY